MRPQKVPDTEILTGLTHIFRSKGYEGASLKDLSEATGLKKASLYHRFPNGKQEMADAVLRYMNTWVQEHIFQLVLDTSLAPQIRLKNGLAQIRTLYNGGNDSCILRALSMEAGIELFAQQLENGMKEWIGTFKKVGITMGLNSNEAEKKALQVLIEIQGSLVVAKGLNDGAIFESTLLHIEQYYLGK